MALPQTRTYVTPEEYLAFEREAEERHEYDNGQVYAMAGESWDHSIINSNLNGEVRNKLKGGPCRSLSPNMKIGIGVGKRYYYPDLAVVCGGPQFHNQRRDIVTNPRVIFEILSPSTESRDRGEKLIRYMQIESLTDYLLVAQSQPLIQHFFKQENGQWGYAVYAGLSDVTVIRSLNCDLALAEVYDGVEFPPEEPEPDADNPEGV